MSTTARGRLRPHDVPGSSDAAGATLTGDESSLVLLQHHQVGLITPALVRDAERRLDQALSSARDGRLSHPGLLLEQLLTDLGVTLSLP